MTGQEIYDTVAAHLIRQGRPAVNDTGGCMYRTPEGLRCAVGCLIPDEVYCPDMEFRPAYDIVYETPALCHLRAHAPLLRRLQTVHDDWAFARDSEYAAQQRLMADLRRVAQDCGLSSEVVTADQQQMREYLAAWLDGRRTR